jgi:hypothetical protein
MLIKALPFGFHACMIFVKRLKSGKCINFGLGLCETKVFASGGDGCEDLLTEDLVALIFGKIKFCFSLVQGQENSGRMLTVEARVRTWKTILVAMITMDIETTVAIHALQLFESVKWDFAGTCDEL